MARSHLADVTSQSHSSAQALSCAIISVLPVGFGVLPLNIEQWNLLTGTRNVFFFFSVFTSFILGHMHNLLFIQQIVNTMKSTNIDVQFLFFCGGRAVKGEKTTQTLSGQLKAQARAQFQGSDGHSVYSALSKWISYLPTWKSKRREIEIRPLILLYEKRSERERKKARESAFVSPSDREGQLFKKKSAALHCLCL